MPVFNTDQSSQFTSQAFTGVLEATGVRISMDGKGSCYDNPSATPRGFLVAIPRHPLSLSIWFAPPAVLTRKGGWKER